MAFALDDIIQKKKDPNHILDLSKTKIKSKEEFEKYFDKVPEYKIRPEKVRYDDIKVRDTDFVFALSKKDIKAQIDSRFIYDDPCPPSMRSVRLEDLAAVDINWRMLTMARPKNRLEDDIFSRIVEMGKLRLHTSQDEANRIAAAANSNADGPNGNAFGVIITKNKRGQTETRLRVCKECGEELCTGTWCKEFPYDSYTRMLFDKDDMENQEDPDDEGGTKRRGSKTNKKPNKNNKIPPKGNFKIGRKRRKKKKKKAAGSSESEQEQV